MNTEIQIQIRERHGALTAAVDTAALELTLLGWVKMVQGDVMGSQTQDRFYTARCDMMNIC